MEISEHDKKVLDECMADFERATGKKAAHVFIDTKEHITDGECWCEPENIDSVTVHNQSH